MDEMDGFFKAHKLTLKEFEVMWLAFGGSFYNSR